MLVDVANVSYKKDYLLEIIFEDGVSGTVNFAELIKFEGVFQPLSDQNEFKKVFVNKEVGTICWPNGADFSSDVLYSKITNTPIKLGSDKKTA